MVSWGDKMKSKILLLIILGMLFLPFVTSMDCDGTFLGTFEQDTNISLRQVCDSCTYVTFSSLTYPNSTTTSINTNMTKIGVDYSYIFYAETNGEYYYSVFGDKDGTIATETFCFKVNPTSNELDIPTAIILILILGLLSLFLLFSINGIKKSISGVWMIAYSCLTYVVLYLILGFLYLLSLYYLWMIPIFESILYIAWFAMGIGFLPFVIIITLYILGQEAKAVMHKDFMNQGYTRDEASDLSKRRKR